jgi:hypothetical protein
MPNPHRGEIEACLDGKSFRLCLTLGALASSSTPSARRHALAGRALPIRAPVRRDAQRIIGAGLRGAGHEILDEAVGRMQAEGGVAGFVDIVARLLGATFGGPAAIVPPLAPQLRHAGVDPRRGAPARGNVPALSLGRGDGAGLGLLRLPPPTSGP